MDLANTHLSSEATLWPVVRQRLRSLCGLVLGEDQIYLLRRLEPVARAHGFSNVSGLLGATLSAGRPDLEAALIESMTTHESSFFRDVQFWETLRRTILPQLAELNRPIHIWSAACSHGQEPYSIAMTMDAHFPKLDFEIWATDIAEDTLKRAESGVYLGVEAERGLSPAMLAKYFDASPDGHFRAKSLLRRNIRFDRYNLLGAAHPLRRFDLICCRNVLVYFDDPCRERVTTRLVDALTPEGWLGLGATELPVREVVGVERLQEGGGWLARRR